MKNLKLTLEGKTIPVSETIERPRVNFFKSISKMITKIKKINDQGRVLPMFGICLGFETTFMNDGGTYVRFNSKNDVNKFHGSVWLDQKKPSNYFKRINGILKDVFKEKLFQNYHEYGYTYENFKSTPDLFNNYNVLSLEDVHDYLETGPLKIQTTTVKEEQGHQTILKNLEIAKKGEPNIEKKIRKNEDPDYLTIKNTVSDNFVTLVENKKYPFFGTMFHPEKPLYEITGNPHVPTNHRMQRANEVFHLAFMEQIIDAKVKNLKKKGDSSSLIDNLEGIKKYMLRDCRLTMDSKGCRRFDYNLLNNLKNEYNFGLSQQILLDFDSFNNKEFGKKCSKKKQLEILKRRFLLKKVGDYSEILLIKN